VGIVVVSRLLVFWWTYPTSRPTAVVSKARNTEGAAALIESINRVYGLKVDTKELLDKA